MNTRVKVPEGMLKAACEANDEYSDEGTNRRVLEAALQWLSENADEVAPTEKQYREFGVDYDFAGVRCIRHWLSVMFLAPNEDEAIRDLLLIDAVTFELPNGGKFAGIAQEHNNAVREAYRRGKEGK